MSPELLERETAILDRLARNGAISVSVLAKEFQVSEVTIRTNLKSLEERGLLTRTRGGARPLSYKNVLDRQRLNTDAKSRIAAAAAELVQDDDRVMIEAGTTTSLVPRYLTSRTGVQVVTNSLLAFHAARDNAAIGVILTGGVFRAESESLVGPIALQAITNFNARIAFVGTDGFTAARGMTTRLVDGADVIKSMRDHTEEIWLMADSSKYGKAGFVSILPLTQLSGVITDTGIGAEALAEISELVKHVLVV